MPKHTQPTLPADAELVLPEQVTIALAELAGAAREGLLALAVGAGLGVLGSLLDADVERLAGPKGRHNPQRAAVRHGTQPGRVTLGGRRVRVDRPRVRSADGTGELPLPTWQVFAATELLDRLALERMLAKLSTRRYKAGLEPVGAAVEQAATGTSKSAVSRRFVAATERALAELLVADLSGLDLVALMVDGVRVAEHCCVVALGITLDGTKVPLGLAEGATENATVVRDLLAGLRDRGWIRPGRSWSSSTAPRRCAAPSPTCSTTRSSNDASFTSCGMSPTGCPRRLPRPWPRSCAVPITTPTHCSPRPSLRPEPVSWTTPTQAPPHPYAKAWPRP
jgi:putative transposase